MNLSNPRLDALAQAATGLPEYSGWDPVAIKSNILDVAQSRDTGRALRLSAALGGLDNYLGWKPEEITANVTEMASSYEEPFIKLPDYGAFGPQNLMTEKPVENRQVLPAMELPSFSTAPASSTGISAAAKLPQQPSDKTIRNIATGVAKKGAEGLANTGIFLTDVGTLAPIVAGAAAHAVGAIPGDVGDFSRKIAGKIDTFVEDLQKNKKTIRDFYKYTPEEQRAMDKGGIAAAAAVGMAQAAALIPQIIATQGTAPVAGIIEAVSAKYGPEAAHHVANMVSMGATSYAQAEGAGGNLEQSLEAGAGGAAMGSVFGAANKVAGTVTKNAASWVSNLAKRGAQGVAGGGVAAIEGRTPSEIISNTIVGAGLPAGKKFTKGEPSARTIRSDEGRLYQEGNVGRGSQNQGSENIQRYQEAGRTEPAPQEIGARPDGLETKQMTAVPENSPEKQVEISKISDRTAEIDRMLEGAKDPGRIKKRLVDPLLGEYGVTSKIDMEDAASQLDAANIPYSMVAVDIGNMKAVNDIRGGHVEADKDLRSVFGEIWSSEVRKNGGIPFRTGGDELGELWPGRNAEEVKIARGRVEEKIRKKRDELGFSDTPHARHGLPTGALHTDYAVLDATRGKFGESWAEVDRAALQNKMQNELEIAKAKGYTYNERTKKYEHAIQNAEVRDTGRQQPATGIGIPERAEATAERPSVPPETAGATGTRGAVQPESASVAQPIIEKPVKTKGRSLTQDYTEDPSTNRLIYLRAVKSAVRKKILAQEKGQEQWDYLMGNKIRNSKGENISLSTKSKNILEDEYDYWTGSEEAQQLRLKTGMPEDLYADFEDVGRQIQEAPHPFSKVKTTQEEQQLQEEEPWNYPQKTEEQTNVPEMQGQGREEGAVEQPQAWPEPPQKQGEKRPAVLLNSKVFTGTSHAMATEKAFAETSKPDPKSLNQNLFLKDGVLLNRDGTPYQTELEGFADTRKPYEIEQARREQGRLANKREQPLEGTMFDQNEMEARATEQGDLFKESDKIVPFPKRQARTSYEEKISAMEKEPSATVMGGVVYDPTGKGNLPKYAGNVNVDRIGGDYDAKRAVNDLADEYRSSIDANKGQKATHEETIQLSEQVGLSKETLLKRNRGEVWDRAKTLAARDLHIKAVERLVQKKNEIIKKRVEGKLTDQDMVDFLLEEKRVAAIQAEISGLAAEAGRLLESFKIMSQGKRAKETFESIKDKIEGGKSTEAILDGLAKIDDSDISTISKFIRRANKTTIAERINRYFIESILSALPTDEANVAGNIMFSGMRTFAELPLSAITEKVVAPLQGRKPEIQLAETKHEAAGLVNAIVPAWKALVRTLLTGEQKYIPKPTEDIKSPSKSKLAAVLPTRRLAAEDEFFKTIAFGAKIRAVAYRKAKEEGLRGKVMDDRIKEITQNPELFPDEYAAAWNEAKYRTFTDDAGEITKAINKIRRSVPGKLAYYVVPFLNTPIKILKAALDRMPVTGEISVGVKAARGLLKGKDVSEEIGKLIPAHLLAIPIVMLARSGLITGAGPTKKEEKNVWNKTHQPYSVKIGDKYYSYVRFEPMSSIIGMTADFSILDMTEENQDQAQEIATRIANSIQQNIYNKTFFSQLDALVSAAQEPGKYGEKFIANIAGATVPNVVAKAGESFDPYVREKSGVKEIIQGKIPGAMNLLFPKRDIWGQPIERDKKGIAASLSPVSVRKISPDKIDVELDRLNVKVGNPNRTVFGIKLNDQQYDDYSTISGQGAYERVSEYINSENYKSTSDDTKKYRIKKIFEVSREVAGNKLKTKYDLFDISEKIRESNKPPNELFNELKKSGINMNRSEFWKKYRISHKK